MIKSMTGYGKVQKEYHDKKIVVELKSLNSKQMDISARIASLYRPKEIELRNLLAQALERGKVDFALYIDNAEQQVNSLINESLVANYYQQIKQLSANTGIPEPQDWYSVLMRMPDVLKPEAKELDDTEYAAVLETVNEAIVEFNNFRAQEGAGLAKFFTTKIDNIRELLAQVDLYEKPRIDKIKQRLEDNLKAISEKITYDQNRLEQELIFYVEKLDISEEKQRLAHHLDYFIDTMNEEKSNGKKLGFIVQEMGREINTLGSKANQGDLQIVVVKMKDELEQIKEQILNVL